MDPTRCAFISRTAQRILPYPLTPAPPHTQKKNGGIWEGTRNWPSSSAKPLSSISKRSSSHIVVLIAWCRDNLGEFKVQKKELTSPHAYSVGNSSQSKVECIWYFGIFRVGAGFGLSRRWEGGRKRWAPPYGWRTSWSGIQMYWTVTAKVCEHTFSITCTTIRYGLIIGSVWSDFGISVRTQVWDFLVAGRDTTASAATWLTYFLIRNPSAVDRVRQGKWVNCRHAD